MARDSEAPSPPLEPSDPGPWPSSDSGSPIERGALKRLELTRESRVEFTRTPSAVVGLDWTRPAKAPRTTRLSAWPAIESLRADRRYPVAGSDLSHLRFQLLLLSLHRCLPGATTPQKTKQHKTAAHKYADFSRVPVGCVCAQRPQVARTSACVECPPTRPRAERICTAP